VAHSTRSFFCLTLPAGARVGFAASTGWRMNSEYAPMPAYLAEYMNDFFAVQNTLLFNLIGRNFSKDW
jgi:hypothetical protein